MVDKSNNLDEALLKTFEGNLNNQLHRLRSQVEDLEEIVAEYKARISILEEEEEEERMKIAELEMNNRILTDKSVELNGICQDFKGKIHNYKEKLIELESLHEDLKGAITESHGQLKNLEKEKTDLKQEIVDVQNAVILNRDLAAKYEVEATSIKGMIEIEKIKQSNLAKQAMALENIIDRT